MKFAMKNSSQQAFDKNLSRFVSGSFYLRFEIPGEVFAAPPPHLYLFKREAKIDCLTIMPLKVMVVYGSSTDVKTATLVDL
jgi:hypothetical protein